MIAVARNGHDARNLYAANTEEHVEPIRVVGLNCSLKSTAKSSDKPSSTEAMLGHVVEQMERHAKVDYEHVRVADFDVKPGVEEDEGAGDEWPQIAEKVKGCEVLLFGTPTWVGHPSSIAQRVMERMDAWLFTYNERGQKLMYGRCAGVVNVGNEDGGHHVHAEVAQALTDFGFVIPPEARVYWSGWTDDSPGPDYIKANGKEHPSTKYMLEHTAHNLVYFATLLRTHTIPALPSDLEAASDQDDS